MWVHTNSRSDPASFAGRHGYQRGGVWGARHLVVVFDLVFKAREGLDVKKAACGAHTASLLVDGGGGKWEWCCTPTPCRFGLDRERREA